MNPVEDLAAMQARNGTDPMTAAERLNALLSLPDDAKVRGARVTGQGSKATAEIDLLNGATMIFDSLRDMTRPANLVAEVAACAGVAITVKQPAAVQAVVLVRALAEHTAGTNDNDNAIDWGVAYLQSAQIVDVNMDDQRERWGAFGLLRNAQPETHNAPQVDGTAYAGATIVLRAHDGARFVRAGWFQRYVCRQDSTISRHDVTVRMLRVGWEIRGKLGRIKATCPGRNDKLSWAFLLVPAGWENDR